MCVAHGKKIASWLRNQETIELVEALAKDLGFKPKYAISHNSGAARISAAYPTLLISKRGSPEAGGGTWLHPDLAIQLAQWCNPFFAIQVSRWVREWLSILEQKRRAEEEKRNEWRAIKACALPGSVAIATSSVKS